MDTAPFLGATRSPVGVTGLFRHLASDPGLS